MAEDSRASGNERRHHRRKRHTAEEKEPERKKKKRLHQEVKKIKHVETFYEKPPPGMIKEDDDKPEDCIPDLPGNEGARDFLAHAPTKGLWMPLGKEVKVMQCWRCKNFGHRTGDRECPYFISGNQKLEQFRVERMRDHADATTTDDRTPCNNHQAGVFPSSQGTLPQSRTFSLRLSGKYSPGRPSRYTTTQNRRAHLVAKFRTHSIGILGSCHITCNLHHTARHMRIPCMT